MCKLHLVTLFALLSAGQYTPTELPLSAQNQLQVTFPASGVTVRSAGQQLTTSQTLQAPQIGTAQQLAGTYLWLMYDPDGTSSTDHLTNPLHALYTDLTSAATTTTTTSPPSPDNPLPFFTLSSSTTAPLAPYVYPQPNPGSPPHHYTCLVYRQPANFSFPLDPSYLILNRTLAHSRYNFPILTFLQQAGLERTAPYATYWLEAAGPSSNSTSTSTSTPTSTPKAVYTGGASAPVTRGVRAAVGMIAALVLW